MRTNTFLESLLQPPRDLTVRSTVKTDPSSVLVTPQMSWAVYRSS